MSYSGNYRPPGKSVMDMSFSHNNILANETDGMFLGDSNGYRDHYVVKYDGHITQIAYLFDDSSNEYSNWSNGTITFKVYVNDVLKFTSDTYDKTTWASQLTSVSTNMLAGILLDLTTQIPVIEADLVNMTFTTSSAWTPSGQAEIQTNLTIIVAEDAGTSSGGGGGGASDKIYNSNGKCEVQSNGDIYIDTKLGIGTDAPGTLLHLKKETTTSGTPVEVLRLQNYEGSGQNLVAGDGPSINFYVAEGDPPGNITELGGKLAVVRESGTDSNGASAMTFWTAPDDTAPTEKMRITSAGLVGIGTTSPILKTQIHGTHGAPTTSGSPTSGILRLSQTAGTLVMDMGTLTSGSNNGGWIQTYVNNDATAHLQLYLNPSGGNVSVNKTTPGTSFDVNGVVNASGGYTQVSDDRIKYNETSIEGIEALSIISQLKPEKYEKITQEPNDNKNLGTWIPTDAEWNAGAKDNFTWDNEAGLIAQDVRSISQLSFTVTGKEVDDEGNQTLLQLNYNDIYAYHISATKELSSQLNEEKAKIATLETQITEQQNTIDELLLRVSALENS